MSQPLALPKLLSDLRCVVSSRNYNVSKAKFRPNFALINHL